MGNDDLDFGDDNDSDDWDNMVDCMECCDMSDIGTQGEVFVYITDDEGLGLIGITVVLEGE